MLYLMKAVSDCRLHAFSADVRDQNVTATFVDPVDVEEIAANQRAARCGFVDRADVEVGQVIPTVQEALLQNGDRRLLLLQ